MAVAGGVAEPIKKVASRTCRQCDAACEIVAEKRAAVINDVKLAADRVDDDLIERLVVVYRVAMQPVTLNGQAGDVGVQSSGVVRDSFAAADVI